jgi:hypothetical protein
MQLRFDAARELVQRALSLAEARGLDVSGATHVRPAIADIELLARGDLALAEREMRLAIAETEATGELGFLSSMTPVLIDVLLAQGRDEEALEATDRWRADRLTVPEDGCARGLATRACSGARAPRPGRPGRATRP